MNTNQIFKIIGLIFLLISSILFVFAVDNQESNIYSKTGIEKDALGQCVSSAYKYENIIKEDPFKKYNNWWS